VLFDARMLNVSGIGIYIQNLIKECLLASPELSYVLVGDPSEIQPYIGDLDNAQLGKRIDIVKMIQPIYSAGEQFSLARIMRQYKQSCDIVHFPHFNAPWLMPERAVVTIHDIIHFLFPQFYPQWRLSLAKQVMKNTLRKAERIIAISASAAHDLRDMLPGDQLTEKTRIIYQGKSPLFYPQSHDAVAQFKAQHQLGSYILYVGTRKLHKNLGRMVQAYARLKNDFLELQLVVVGNKSPEDEIGLWKERLGITGIVESPWVSMTQLSLFYCGAEALIVPSLYEGFGLPPLEAMACGTPVVVSKTSSLPEVVGDAGIFFDPYDVEDMSSGLRRFLTDSVLRKKSILRGLDQAALFSWEKTAGIPPGDHVRN